MKRFLAVSIIALCPLSLMAQSFNYELSSFSLYQSSVKKDYRVIEGSSPILGYELVSDLKSTKLHPQKAYEAVLYNNSDFESKAYRASYAYFKTLMPGLNEYCSKKVVTGDRSQWTPARGNHGAAIPQEVIMPLGDNYINELQSTLMYKDNLKNNLMFNTMAKATAHSFQEKRYNCPNVVKLRKLENKMGKFCLGMPFCLKAKKINSVISSAEAAYPRKQFSVNGFTRYVYNELLQTKDLAHKLKVVFDTQMNWLKLADEDNNESQFFEYVINESVDADIHIKDVMLILAYSMRNMPSLDIEYAQAPKKALLLETYFWAFRDLRSTLSKQKYFQDVFPNHEFKRNPGFYHYLTAALLGCEARLAGLSHTSAVMMGIISKIGYKTDKLIKGLEKKKMENLKGLKKLKYIKSTMKKQGYWPGVGAGMHAARFGSKSCRSYKKDLKKEYRQDKKEIRKSDLSRKEKRAQKRKLKKELIKDYRSLLHDKEYWEED